mmetsp:Transcript_160347/g.307717  ORF Transcript_160347/g.307717 Transcript_160347/m.307717 type:complete len:82 (-) Transcript_160347:1944-2189(-)
MMIIGSSTCISEWIYSPFGVSHGLEVSNHCQGHQQQDQFTFLCPQLSQHLTGRIDYVTASRMIQRRWGSVPPISAVTHKGG